MNGGHLIWNLVADFFFFFGSKGILPSFGNEVFSWLEKLSMRSKSMLKKLIKGNNSVA